MIPLKSRVLGVSTSMATIQYVVGDNLALTLNAGLDKLTWDKAYILIFIIE